jgi:hypothetical protein
MSNVKRWIAVGLVAGTLGFGAAPAMASSGAAATAAAPAVHQPAKGVTQVGLINAILNVKHTLNRLKALNIKNVKVVYVRRSIYKVINHSTVLSNHVLVLKRFLNKCGGVSCNNILAALNQDHISISRVLALKILSGNTVRVLVKK